MKMLPRVVNHEWFVFDKERECWFRISVYKNKLLS
jgi:hypothetical protein